MISLLLVIQQFLLSQNERKKKGAEDLSVGREEHKRVQTRASHPRVLLSALVREVSACRGQPLTLTKYRD